MGLNAREREGVPHQPGSLRSGRGSGRRVLETTDTARVFESMQFGGGRPLRQRRRRTARRLCVVLRVGPRTRKALALLACHSQTFAAHDGLKRLCARRMRGHLQGGLAHVVAHVGRGAVHEQHLCAPPVVEQCRVMKARPTLAIAFAHLCLPISSYIITPRERKGEGGREAGGRGRETRREGEKVTEEKARREKGRGSQG